LNLWRDVPLAEDSHAIFIFVCGKKSGARETLT
jgi:hypothetical protein